MNIRILSFVLTLALGLFSTSHASTWRVSYHPSIDGVIDTTAWEGFREGVDDMRYLATLEALVAEHEGTPEAASARTWLESLRRGVTPGHVDLEPIEEESPLLVWLAGKLDGADYRRIRRQAAEHIGRLGTLKR